MVKDNGRNAFSGGGDCRHCRTEVSRKQTTRCCVPSNARRPTGGQRFWWIFSSVWKLLYMCCTVVVWKTKWYCAICKSLATWQFRNMRFAPWCSRLAKELHAVDSKLPSVSFSKQSIPTPSITKASKQAESHSIQLAISATHQSPLPSFSGWTLARVATPLFLPVRHVPEN